MEFDIMSYFNTVVINTDNPTGDAFGRLRVGNPFAIFDNTHFYDEQPLFWDEVTTTGGSSAHQPNIVAMRSSTDGTSGAKVTRQTFQYFRYQPGKSQQFFATATFGAGVANVRRRLGLFDDDDGVFFEQDGANDFNVVVRSSTSGSASDNAIEQASWNIDTLDGTGASKVTLDLSKDNIFVIDYQWLGAGRVRFGFDIDGVVIYVHEFLHANILTTPYSKRGSLPVRTEIESTAASASANLDFYCVSIESEGGYSPLGIERAVSNDVTVRSVTATPLPILSIRPKTTFNSITNRGLVRPEEFTVFTLSNPIFINIVVNGTLTGASWTSVDADSITEYDVSATTISGGYSVDCSYVAGASANKGGQSGRNLLGELALANDIVGTTTNIISIVCTRFTTNSNTSAHIRWSELF
jgi:hypothetical protein